MERLDHIFSSTIELAYIFSMIKTVTEIAYIFFMIKTVTETAYT